MSLISGNNTKVSSQLLTLISEEFMKLFIEYEPWHGPGTPWNDDPVDLNHSILWKWLLSLFSLLLLLKSSQAVFRITIITDDPSATTKVNALFSLSITAYCILLWCNIPFYNKYPLIRQFFFVVQQIFSFHALGLIIIMLAIALSFLNGFMAATLNDGHIIRRWL